MHSLVHGERASTRADCAHLAEHADHGVLVVELRITVGEQHVDIR